MKKKSMRRFYSYTSRKAFTLVELMIAIVLLAVVMAFVLYGIFSSSSQGELEQIKLDVRNKATEIGRVIQSDIERVVKTRGSLAYFSIGASGTNYPNSLGSTVAGLYRRTPSGAMDTVGRGSPSDSDGVVMFQYDNEQFYIQVREVTDDVSDPAQIKVKVVDPDAQLKVLPGTLSSDPALLLAHNARLYFKKVLEDKEGYVVLLNSRTTTIFRIIDYSTSNFEATLKTIGDVPVAPLFTNNDYDSDAAVMVTAKRVDYFVDSGLLKRSESIDGGSNFTETIVSDKVQKIHFNYSFSDRRLSGVLDFPAGIDVSAEYSNPADTLEDVSWADVTTASGAIEVFSEEELPDGLELDNLSGPFSKSSSGAELVYTYRWQYTPPNLEALLRGTNTSTDPTNCIVNNAYARCNEECESVFTGTDRTKPDWEGYGRHINTTDPKGPSNYCLCGTWPNPYPSGDVEFFPPELPAGFDRIPNWTSSMGGEPSPATGVGSYEEHLLGCFRHFQGCDGNFKNRHPKMALYCGSCIYRGDEYVVYPSDVDDRSTPFFTSKWVDFESALESYRTTGAAVEPEANDVRCTNWQSCDDQADWLRRGTKTGDEVAGYRGKCECLTHKLDENGNSTTSAISNSIRDYSRLCDQATCTDLYDSTGNYRIYGEDDGGGGTHDQGLSLSQATYCECREHPEARTTDGRRDFRSNAVPGDPSYDDAGGAPSPVTASSLGSLEATVNTSNGVTHSNQQCNPAQCSTEGWSYGCCTSGALTGTALTEYMADPAASAYPSHQTYCTNNCAWSANVALTRRNIFDVATNDDLPWYCDAPGSSGGSGGATGGF